MNASYEPVALVPVKRAIVLVVSEKAEIVEANLDRRFRSEKAEYPYPLVIRLVKFVEIPRRLRKHVTNAILFARVARDDPTHSAGIWVVGRDGRELRQLSPAGSDPRWLP